MATPHEVLDPTNPTDIAKGITWWQTLTAAGGEVPGFVRAVAGVWLGAFGLVLWAIFLAHFVLN